MNPSGIQCGEKWICLNLRQTADFTHARATRHAQLSPTAYLVGEIFRNNVSCHRQENVIMTSRTGRESDQTQIHPAHQQSGYTIGTSDITPSAETQKNSIESNKSPTRLRQHQPDSNSGPPNRNNEELIRKLPNGQMETSASRT